MTIDEFKGYVRGLKAGLGDEGLTAEQFEKLVEVVEGTFPEVKWTPSVPLVIDRTPVVIDRQPYRCDPIWVGGPGTWSDTYTVTSTGSEGTSFTYGDGVN